MEYPRGFFHVLRTGQRALSFHRCPFSVEGMERCVNAELKM